MNDHRDSALAPTEDGGRVVRRTMIQHEDVLRDQRLGWLLTLNGFLFAGLAFAWDDGSDALIYTLGAVGIATALSSWAGLLTSSLAIKNLRDEEKWATSDPPLVGLQSSDLVELLNKDKPVANPEAGTKRNLVALVLPYLYPWRAIPVILGAIWIAVVVIRLAN